MKYEYHKKQPFLLLSIWSSSSPPLNNVFSGSPQSVKSFVSQSLHQIPTDNWVPQLDGSQIKMPLHVGSSLMDFPVSQSRQQIYRLQYSDSLPKYIRVMEPYLEWKLGLNVSLDFKLNTNIYLPIVLN